MEAFEEASHEEQLLYPRVLKTFHKSMMAAGKTEKTSKQYMRTFSSLLSEDAKVLPVCASSEYHAIVKVSPKNVRGNGQHAASVKAFIEFWEREGRKIYNGEGEFDTLDASDTIYWVRNRPAGAPSGVPSAGRKPTNQEVPSPAKRLKAVDGAAVITAKGHEELVEEYDGFVLRALGDLWTVLPDDVVSIDITAVAPRTEAAGWKCVSADPARCTLQGEAEVTMHADAGKMEVRTSNKEIVLRIAQRFVDAWLVEGDC